MDFMPESTPVTNRDQPHQIITAKRTDHKRPKSPVATPSNSFTNHNTAQSSEEEEEDMANCLIMLAHGVSPLNDDKLCGRKTEKIKIRSVTEMTATTGIGYSGIQCYECKTCNRVFPSFQALGGHRASHKKPKLTLDDDNKPEYPKEYQPKLVLMYEENKTVTNKLTSSVVSDHFVQTGYKNSQAKVHQCSICGSEFLSGQALGGHMRRHRTAPPSLSPTKPNDHVIEKSPVLSLDLNLPPPEVADEGHSSFQFAGGSSQQPLVFSAPALVDCHY